MNTKEIMNTEEINLKEFLNLDHPLLDIIDGLYKELHNEESHNESHIESHIEKIYHQISEVILDLIFDITDISPLHKRREDSQGMIVFGVSESEESILFNITYKNINNINRIRKYLFHCKTIKINDKLNVLIYEDIYIPLYLFLIPKDINDRLDSFKIG